MRATDRTPTLSDLWDEETQLNGEYEKFGRYYGFTPREVMAIFRANDAGCSFTEIAEAIEAVSIPHSDRISDERREAEGKLVSDLMVRSREHNASYAILKKEQVKKDGSFLSLSGLNKQATTAMQGILNSMLGDVLKSFMEKPQPLLYVSEPSAMEPETLAKLIPAKMVDTIIVATSIPIWTPPAPSLDDPFGIKL